MASTAPLGSSAGLLCSPQTLSDQPHRYMYSIIMWRSNALTHGAVVHFCGPRVHADMLALLLEEGGVGHLPYVRPEVARACGVVFVVG